MMNVHASGGRRMMTAAQEALAELPKRPLLIAVTVLTSMSAEDLAEVEINPLFVYPDRVLAVDVLIRAGSPP